MKEALDLEAIREAAEYDTLVSCSECCLRQATKILALLAEIERLRKFAGHHDSCETKITTSAECDCGWESASPSPREGLK